MGATAVHSVNVVKRGRKVIARCSCGWWGHARQANWEARLDGRAHREGWSSEQQG